MEGLFFWGGGGGGGAGESFATLRRALLCKTKLECLQGHPNLEQGLMGVYDIQGTLLGGPY